MVWLEASAGSGSIPNGDRTASHVEDESNDDDLRIMDIDDDDSKAAKSSAELATLHQCLKGLPDGTRGEQSVMGATMTAGSAMRATESATTAVSKNTGTFRPEITEFDHISHAVLLDAKELVLLLNGKSIGISVLWTFNDIRVTVAIDFLVDVSGYAVDHAVIVSNRCKR
ncbi:hypothetical protein Ancab_038112 [Ancistrocladus abbreviatus]